MPLLNTVQEVLGPSGPATGVWRPYVTYDPTAPGADANGPYRMWYTAFSSNYNDGPTWVEHAWSHDGLVWQNRQSVHTADPRGEVVSGYNQNGWPVAVKTDSGYRLYQWMYYFSGLGGWNGCVDMAIGSSDGLTFTQHIQHAMDPLHLPGGWDNYIVFPGSVLQENGQTVLYYWTHGDPDTNRGGWVGRAVSADGVTWPSTEGPNREAVMERGATGDWDWFHFSPAVVHRDDLGEYWMFFVGQSSQDPQTSMSTIAFARSADGVNWTDKIQLFTEQDLAQVLGTAVERVGTPRYFHDPQNNKDYLYLDYLANSGLAKIVRVELVPEPATLALALAGLAGLPRRHRR